MHSASNQRQQQQQQQHLSGNNKPKCVRRMTHRLDIGGGESITLKNGIKREIQDDLDDDLEDDPVDVIGVGNNSLLKPRQIQQTLVQFARVSSS